jgi:hypothetical protein
MNRYVKEGLFSNKRKLSFKDREVCYVMVSYIHVKAHRQVVKGRW